MPTYALVELEVTNMAGMGPYLAAVEDTITKHGGRYLVRGGSTEVLEGALGHPVKVFLEFPSNHAAHAWYNSSAYQSIISIRKFNAIGNFILVEGI